MSIVFLDVETPNRLNNRICSIGIVCTDDDLNVELCREYVVNPETGFDRMNSAIHGIGQKDVQDAPTFDEIWEKDIRDMLAGSLVVAHNAIFDLTVLDKTLSYYGKEIFPIEYACTMQAARYAGLPCTDSKLPTLCSMFSIPLEKHHNALSDTLACKDVFAAMKREGYIDTLCASRFEHSPYCPEATASRVDKAAVGSMTDLYGRIVGIGIDRIIASKELEALEDWMRKNRSRRREPIYREAFALLEEVLEDGAITPKEYEALLNYSRPFLESSKNSEMQTLLGIIRGIAADEKIGLSEAVGLEHWLSCHKELETDKTYSRVFALTKRILEDGVITKDEESELLNCFKKLTEPATQEETICSFEGKSFCLTGDFDCGAKSEVASKIEAKGGVVRSSVSKKCHYVVVGGRGSSDYAYGNYGTKVKKAMELQDQGCSIQIIQEVVLLQSLEN